MSVKKHLLSLLIIALILATFTSPILAVGVTVDPEENVFNLDFGEILDEEVTVTLPVGSSVAKADVYLLADSTGSMGSPIAALQANDVALVDELLAAFPEADIQFGVGDFKDFPYPQDPYAFRHSVSITNDITSVKAAINNWVASGGGDMPEGQFFAYDQLAEDRNPLGGTIGWRADARKILVVFGDAPANDPIPIAATGFDYDITEALLTDKMVDAGITFIGISTPGIPGAMDAAPVPYFYPVTYPDYESTGTAGQATRIADATGGVHLIGVTSLEIVSVIQAEIAKALTPVTTIDTLNLLPVGEIVQFVNSISPDSVGPLASDEEHVLPFDVKWEGVVEAQETDQVFTGALNVVADGIVIGFKPVEITVPGTGTPPPPPPPPDDETEFEEESAWGEGDRFVQRGNWAMFFELSEGEDKKVVSLIAGQHMNVGNVTISRNESGDELTVTYSALGQSKLTEVHLAVENLIEGIPTTRQGNPQIGLFEFSRSFEDGVSETTFYVDISHMEGDIFVAAHAVVQVAK